MMIELTKNEVEATFTVEQGYEHDAKVNAFTFQFISLVFFLFSSLSFFLYLQSGSVPSVSFFQSLCSSVFLYLSLTLFFHFSVSFPLYFSLVFFVSHLF